MVAFSRSGVDGGIWIIPSTGGRATRFTASPGFHSHSAWSPDGELLAFISDRDGREHIWVGGVHSGLPKGEPRQLTEGDVIDHFPEWSPGGDRLAFVRHHAGGSEVWIVDLASGQASQLTTGARADRALWDPLKGGLLVSGRWDDGRLAVRSVSLDDGVASALEPTPVLGSTASFGQLAVSEDGRLLAYTVYDADGDLWMAEVSGGRL